MAIVIYHNPGCGTSRNVLAIIEAAGYMPKFEDRVDQAPASRTLCNGGADAAHDAPKSPAAGTKRTFQP